MSLIERLNVTIQSYARKISQELILSANIGGAAKMESFEVACDYYAQRHLCRD